VWGVERRGSCLSLSLSRLDPGRAPSSHPLRPLPSPLASPLPGCAAPPPPPPLVAEAGGAGPHRSRPLDARSDAERAPRDARGARDDGRVPRDGPPPVAARAAGETPAADPGPAAADSRPPAGDHRPPPADRGRGPGGKLGPGGESPGGKACLRAASPSCAANPDPRMAPGAAAAAAPAASC
jgi:hypothetical protein